jgi:DNA repair protein RecO (recombination protein O)
VSGGGRVQLAPAFVLHAREYRETSRILELYTREHGRLTAFARGTRGPKARLAGVVQPFRRLLVSWSGRGEAVQLSSAELCQAGSGPQAPLPAAALMPAWYLNELLMRLSTRHDPQPDIFDDYESALAGLALGAIEPSLRRFEKRLLEHLGYGVDFTRDGVAGEPVRPGCRYRFQSGVGLCAAPGSLADETVHDGAALIDVAAERFADPGALEAARRVLRLALDELLDGRELATRTVARAIVRSAAGRPGRVAGGG